MRFHTFVLLAACALSFASAATQAQSTSSGSANPPNAAAVQADDLSPLLPDAEFRVPDTSLQQRDGFYSNAPKANGPASRARSDLAGSVNRARLDVAPALQLREACIRECLRMNYPEAECDKGCQR